MGAGRFMLEHSRHLQVFAAMFCKPALSHPIYSTLMLNADINAIGMDGKGKG